MTKPRKYYIVGFLGFLLLVWFWFCLPQPLFQKPYATILEDQNGALVATRIAADYQWRFPPSDSVHVKFKHCILQFEDAYFAYHPGVNPVSIFKALLTNIKAGKIERGGSTLSMQVIRLAKGNPPRTVFQKVVEMIQAVRLEISYSKEEIVALYTAHAPFGGNVVGLEAASWRYYGRSPHQLSWGEMAALAVLPNAPGLIRPGVNEAALQAKRNRLLKKLAQENIIDSSSCELAIEEALPSKPKAFPNIATHALNFAIANGHQGTRIGSSLEKSVQHRVTQIANRFQYEYAKNNIRNLAIVVREVQTGKVIAYVGNASPNQPTNGVDVDIIQSPRSTGSILKPFLYASALDEGLILPRTLLPDVPTQISGYAPKNFDLTYSGAIAADVALTKSLNVPFVRLLRQYGIPPFLNRLNDLGLHSISKSASHYGLSLILGGAECTLWELTSTYGDIAQDYLKKTSSPELMLQPQHLWQLSEKPKNTVSIFSPSATWFTLDAMAKLNRPREEEGWQYYTDAQKIAWKTGTSFGFRDAWAIGITPDYVVGVWVGNANGEGRDGLTGASKAGPILFETFSTLPKSTWFEKPIKDIQYAITCTASGHLASPYCPKDTIYVPANNQRASICPYHHRINTNQKGNFRVNSSCYPVYKMQQKNWFTLPASWAYYYKKSNVNYKDLPPYLPGCNAFTDAVITMIYPAPKSKIFIPKGSDNQLGEAVFQAAHSSVNAILYWHLDDAYLGETQGIHTYPIQTDKGNHLLTLTDQDGNTYSTQFEVALSD